MTSQQVTSTPGKTSQTANGVAAPPSAPTPPPGTWEHPRLAEISRRRVRDEFHESNLRIVIISAICFVLSFYLPTIWPLTYLSTLDKNLTTIYTILLYFTRTSIFYKGYTAVRPVWRRKDDMSDIALTPSQRALLGLGPASAPATPGSTYITPPRYLRSSSRTNQSVGAASGGGGSSSSRAATIGSEGWDNRSLGSNATNGSWGASPSVFGKSTGVFDSPISRSPLARKAMGQRASLGMGASVSDLGTPSPIGSQQQQQQQRNAGGVGLSNKFLYQRRVASNGGMSSYI